MVEPVDVGVLGEWVQVLSGTGDYSSKGRAPPSLHSQNSSHRCSGTYADEVAVARASMVAAGVAAGKRAEALEEVRRYFEVELGLTGSSRVAVPGSRWPCRRAMTKRAA